MNTGSRALGRLAPAIRILNHKPRYGDQYWAIFKQLVTLHDLIFVPFVGNGKQSALPSLQARLLSWIFILDCTCKKWPCERGFVRLRRGRPKFIYIVLKMLWRPTGKKKWKERNWMKQNYQSWITKVRNKEFQAFSKNKRKKNCKARKALNPDKILEKCNV